MCIFLAEDGFFCGDLPVNAEAFVCDGDASVCLGVIELIALILEDGSLAQHRKTVGKTFWNEELPVIIFCEFYSDVFAVGGRAFAEVDGNVENGTFYAANKFALCVGWALEMQSSHHTIGGHAFVVLHKFDGAYFFFELSLRK